MHSAINFNPHPMDVSLVIDKFLIFHGCRLFQNNSRLFESFKIQELFKAVVGTL